MNASDTVLPFSCDLNVDLPPYKFTLLSLTLQWIVVFRRRPTAPQAVRPSTDATRFLPFLVWGLESVFHTASMFIL